MGDVPGPSTAPYFLPRKATENFARLCQLIMTICSDLLRDVLSRYIKPADLRSELDNNRRKLEKIMNAAQKDLIYPASGSSASTLHSFTKYLQQMVGGNPQRRETKALRHV